MIQQRKKVNSSKVNLIVSAIFHGVLVLAVFYFAAKEGYLGKKLRAIVAVRTTEKPPEPPKQKPPEPKPEQAKHEETKTVSAPQPKMDTAAPPPPAVAAAAAPAAVVLPAMSFDEGAIQVATKSKNQIFRDSVQETLLSRWKRPQNIEDDNYYVDVALTIDKKGNILNSHWINKTGNDQWDQSVKDALDEVTSIGQTPPPGFPSQFVVRFDVEKTMALSGGLGLQ
jgi:protein TonB